MSFRWSPYFWVCFSMCVGVMGTALASPLYPLYQQAWDLRPSQITIVFVAYMVGTLASLLFLGRLSDRLGYLRALRAGLVVVTVGVLVSALAWDMASFTAGRIVIGVASGLITTSASIGLTQLNRARGGDLQRAASTTSLTMAAGFGMGPIVGGLIAQWLPAPLFTAYLPSLVLGVLSVYALGRIVLPEAAAPVAVPATEHWLRDFLPRLTFPQGMLRRYFVIGCMCAFCAFGIFSMYASLAPSFMDRMVPWHGPAVSGLSIGIILMGSATTQFLARPLRTKETTIAGLVALCVCNLLMLLNTALGSAWVFSLCVVSTALGHGLCMLAGMSIVNKVATSANRSGLIATYLVVGYLGCIFPILGLGWLSDHVGLSRALVVFCTLLAALTGAVAWQAWRTPRLAHTAGA